MPPPYQGEEAYSAAPRTFHRCNSPSAPQPLTSAGTSGGAAREGGIPPYSVPAVQSGRPRPPWRREPHPGGCQTPLMEAPSGTAPTDTRKQAPLLQKAAKLPRARRVLQLTQRLRFDLPDALARHAELLPDL